MKDLAKIVCNKGGGVTGGGGVVAPNRSDFIVFSKEISVGNPIIDGSRNIS